MGKQMIKRSLNTDLPNEILNKNARILSTAVYRYWHNQFLGRAYAERPPVRDAAYACNREFPLDLVVIKEPKASKNSPGTAPVDSASIGSKKYSVSGSLLSLYSVRCTEFGYRISKVLNFVCCFCKFSSQVHFYLRRLVSKSGLQAKIYSSLRIPLFLRLLATVLLRPYSFAFLLGDMRWTH